MRVGEEEELEQCARETRIIEDTHLFHVGVVAEKEGLGGDGLLQGWGVMFCDVCSRRIDSVESGELRTV